MVNMLRKFFGRGDPDSPKGRPLDDDLYALYRRLEYEDREEGSGTRTMRFEGEATEEQMDYIISRCEEADAEDADEGGWPSRMRPTVWDDYRRRDSSSRGEGDDDRFDDGGDADDLGRDGRVRLSRAAATHAFQGLDALRHDGRFTDVTLVCGDGARLPCHRVVLCASSAYFRSLLVERDRSASPTECLDVLPTLPSAAVAAAVDYAYGAGVPILAAAARREEEAARLWPGLDGAVRALRHFEMGHAVEHVFRAGIEALERTPAAYLLAVDLHSLADAHGCEPLKHKAWQSALNARWAAYKRPPLEGSLSELEVAETDVDDASAFRPVAEGPDARDVSETADLCDPPHDAATAVAAWHRKLKTLRTALDPKPPSEYSDDDDDDGTYENRRRSTIDRGRAATVDDDGSSAMDESDGGTDVQGPMM